MSGELPGVGWTKAVGAANTATERSGYFPPNHPSSPFCWHKCFFAAWGIEARNWNLAKQKGFSHSGSLPGHWKVQHKGGSKPWVREGLLSSEAIFSLEYVCTWGSVVCVWLQGYQSGLGCPWDVRKILLNGRVEEVHAWWVYWSRINGFRQAWYFIFGRNTFF